MTRNTFPLAAPNIPHHLAHEILDRSTGNWPAWEKTVLSCLILAGLDGYPAGTVPCPNPAVDPSGAAVWYTNDRAVVSFLALKASRSEQTYIASYAAGGSKAVWDALLARHFDVGGQIRLMQEAFSVRYGLESPAATSARIDALVMRIFALGPISKTTLTSAVMANAVQGDTQKLNSVAESQVDNQGGLGSRAEQIAVSAVAAELSVLQRELSPAVQAFIQLSSANEAEWTRLLELLFQVLGRLDGIAIAPDWERAILARQNASDEAAKLQRMLENSNDASKSRNRPPPRVNEGEQIAMTAVAAEMSNVQNELAPLISDYLQREPDEKERSRLIELLVQCLVRLDGIVVESGWEAGRSNRKRAVDEVLRLLNTLDWSPGSKASPTHTISQAEQSIIAHIASELSNIHNILAPAVATFPRPSVLEADGKERRHLSRLLFEIVERLDATRINLDWEQARKERRSAVKAAEELQHTLDGYPSCKEEQDAIKVFASERSNTHLLLFPAVTAYLRNPNERERARLSEQLFQVLERLDGVALEPAWDQARRERREAVNEVQTLQNSIEPQPSSTESSTSSTTPSGQYVAISAIACERSKIQSELSPAVVLFVRTFQATRPVRQGPNEKERLRLSELSLRFLERLDAVAIESDWEEARRQRRSAVKEVQKLQEMLDAIVF
ncbi:hypothetical protein DFH09DRAFT_244939 [Mycena vulgaris]|nr:hypothetical protein DFH09DRAFT_244939 [Mycena vulgaris]